MIIVATFVAALVRIAGIVPALCKCRRRRGGDHTALNEVFAKYPARLRRMGANPNPNDLNTLGTIFYRAGRFEDAIARLRKDEEGRQGRPRHGLGVRGDGPPPAAGYRDFRG